MLSISFPTGPLFATVLLLGVARFENQRWVRARMRGMRGENELFGQIVDLSFNLGTIAFYVLLGIFIMEFGFVFALSMLASTVVISMIWAALIPDNFIFWFAGFLATWPLLFWLATYTSWL